MTAMKRVLFVAAEPPWPTNQGGRVRMAGLIEGLRAQHHVDVAAWPYDPTPSELVTHVLPAAEPATTLSGFASRTPRISRALYGKNPARAVSALLRDYDCAVYSHSYLAAVLPLDLIPTVVDFPNIEVQRYRQFAATRSGFQRWSARVEGAKASRWEPQVARQAGLPLALSVEDLAVLRKDNAAACLVENGVRAQEVLAPPVDPDCALFFASMDYGPNQAAARWLAHQVWPIVRQSVPEARLLIAGRASTSLAAECTGPGVEVRGEVDQPADIYREAAVVLAAVRSGAGRQLKVIEALAFGRPVVATTYSLDSVPGSMRTLVPAADDPAEYAAQVVRLMSDRGRYQSAVNELDRRRHELPLWQNLLQPVNRWIEENAR